MAVEATQPQIIFADAERIVFLADGRVVDEMRSPTPAVVYERMKKFGE
jgi:putative ABC transport system ATP-binding protein